MLWEVERLLNECKKLGNLPKILLLENVPDLVNFKFVKSFQKWRDKLESLGYSSYCEILNAKNYQMPQNRKRVFCISILGECNYSFPKKIHRTYNLGDLLEDKNGKMVDEKYFLSPKMIKGMLATKFNSYKLENRLQERGGDNRYLNNHNRCQVSPLCKSGEFP